jgi:hypothetical protein
MQESQKSKKIERPNELFDGVMGIFYAQKTFRLK